MASKWQKLRPHVYYAAESRPGVYVFLLNGRSFYVGQATDVRRRIKSHNIYNQCGFYPGDGFMHTSWRDIPWEEGKLTGKVRYCEAAELNSIERALIRRLSPEMNITHNRKRPANG